MVHDRLILDSFFVFNDTATTVIYTYWHSLSLHVALPIYIHHPGYASIAGGAVAGFTDLLGKRWFRVAGIRTTRADGKPLCWSEILVPEDRKSTRLNSSH